MKILGLAAVAVFATYAIAGSLSTVKKVATTAIGMAVAIFPIVLLKEVLKP